MDAERRNDMKILAKNSFVLFFSDISNEFLANVFISFHETHVTHAVSWNESQPEFEIITQESWGQTSRATLMYGSVGQGEVDFHTSG